jgi:DNA-binding response OmpR family regulator
VARLLIIDDDLTVSLTLTRMLEHQGHAVDHAESGQSGLEIAARTPPDAIILDMRMPGMDGLDFLKQLRADTRFVTLPVGIITGDYFITEPVIEELARLGATVRYKPVWLDDLTELTETLLGRQRES